MDFPVCPSCKQSVIDDDAVDCPFCGASMKAKPGAKAAPAAPAAPKPVATAAKAPPAKPAAGKPTLPGDDFPFDVELTAGKAAIQAMPNPTKQRTLKVVCPMCGTPGYLPQNAAGQEVRCVDPKCLVPVFTAPAPKKAEVAPPPPPPKSSNLPFIAGTTLLLAGTALGGLYFVMSQPGGSNAAGKHVDEDALAMMREASGGPKKPVPGAAAKKDTPPGQAKGKEDAAAPPQAAAIDKEKLIKSALSQMKESALTNTALQRKPYCRQLAAEACALIGDSVAFREHMEQLTKVGKEVPYFSIIPLLEFYWTDLTKGDKKAAASSLTAAMAEVSKIPKQLSRARLEIGGRLMTALVAAGQQEDALKMLPEFQTPGLEGQVAARLQIAMDGRISPLSDQHSVLLWKFPQAVAVTGSLMNRGKMDLAAKWASSQSTDDAKAECLSFWAEHLAFTKAAEGTVDVDGAIAAAVSSLPPAWESRVWSRAGIGRKRAGDEKGVLAAIKLAQSKLDEVSKPIECSMPTVKQLIDFKVPPLDPLLRGAIAAGELANLQIQLEATKADAENSLDLALAFMDATAPSLAVAQQRQAEVEKMRPTGLMKLLKDELRKKNDDEARTAANNYVRSLTHIVEAAQRRFHIETQLLSRLRGAGLGLNLKIWIIVDARTTAGDINKRDNFFETRLAGELREGLKGTAEEQAILGAWRSKHPDSEPPPPVAVEFIRRAEANPSNAVDYLTKAELKDTSREEAATRREEIELMAASKFTAEGKTSVALNFIARVRDIFDRENCYRLVASLATRKGQAEEMWKQVSKVNEPTEKVALCRGLIGGLLDSDK